MVMLLAGCGGEEIVQRPYREVTTVRAAPKPQAATEAPQQVALSWQAPEGWEERPGSGMRRVGFGVGESECTITSFPGDVGGMKANLRRWLGQLDVPDPAEADMDRLIAEASAFTAQGGMSGQLLDFGSLAPGEQSMLAAVFEKDGWSVFVKLMGSRTLLAEERARFVQLCESLQ